MTVFVGYVHAEETHRAAYQYWIFAPRHPLTANPARRDAPADIPGRRNRELAKRIKTGWQSGKPDEAATARLLSVLRNGTEQEAPAQVVELLDHGVDPKSIWDALFAGAAELLMRQPGIVALHAVTTTNALHYAWQHCRDDSTRRYALLENAAFLPMFRQAMAGRGRMADRQIDRMTSADTTASREGVDAILAEISRSPSTATSKVLGYLQSGGKAEDLMRAARSVLLTTANDAHDYKFSSAVFEDFNSISAPWRDRFLAASVLRLHGSQDRAKGVSKPASHAARWAGMANGKSATISKSKSRARSASALVGRCGISGNVCCGSNNRPVSGS